MTNTITLTGLRGDNPLAYLAALGTLRVLALANPGNPPRMSWRTKSGAWRPVLHCNRDSNADALAAAVDGALREHCGPEPLQFADNTCIDPAVFRCFAKCAADTATSRDRRLADFAAAFGCEALKDNQGRVQDTALRTMSGAGHQHFLKFARNIRSACTRDHIKRDLFETWQYCDPVQNHTLRLDPLDGARYALRWSDPSGDPSRQQRGSVYGANRLAIEAFPLFACVPRRGVVRTVGFVDDKSNGIRLRWPIWAPPISLDTVRSLLTLPADTSNGAQTQALRARGVVGYFESRRLTVGKFRCFSPARPV